MISPTATIHIMVVFLLTIGTVLFMKKEGRLFVLLCVTGITLWGYPTIFASETLIAYEFCVELQGERSSVGEEPIFYELYDSAGNVVIVGTFAEAYPTNNDMGCFDIGAVPPGVYDIMINSETDTPDHLNRMVEDVSLAPGLGNEPIILRNAGRIVSLIEGDVNGDNRIDDADLDIFVSTFDISASLCEGMTGYDERADLNEDDCVTILDASLLASNLNPDTPLTGDVPE